MTEIRSGKRFMKNIIVIAVIVVMCGASFFTMKYAADNVSASAGGEMQQEMQGGQMPRQSDSGDSGSDVPGNDTFQQTQHQRSVQEP